MRRLVQVVVPRRLGSSFRWLLASSWTTNFGDGIALAAGPLLVASQTDDPFLVALAATLQWLPPLVFGLHAGALTDRLDRKRIVIFVDLVRALILALIAVTIVTGVVTVWVVLVAMFLLGTAETFSDNAASTLTPMLVHRDDIVLANSRLNAGFITLNQLIGPPIGAALFVLGMALPFFTYAVLMVFGAILITKISIPGLTEKPKVFGGIRTDIREGLRWVRHNAAVRTLILTVTIFNVTFGAAWSVLVLYSTVRLGMGEVGFGLVSTAGALGGLAGVLAYDVITRHVSLANVMRVGLIIETLTHLGLATTTTPWVALLIFFVFGAHAFIWGTTSITIRQRAVPLPLQGRVGSVNLVGVFGGLVVGSAIGGILARSYGLAAPFWFAFVGSAIFLVVIWGQLVHIAHADDEVEPEPL
ncbi:MAG TPA: MFS transporter [Acidimicrobiia bacterium]